MWSDLPDDELLQTAISGKLTEPADYSRQVDRMLVDQRAVGAGHRLGHALAQRR